MRSFVATILIALGIVVLGVPAQAGEPGATAQPGPTCYRKVDVPAVYSFSKRLVRKARLVHEETDEGQIKLLHFPAIYVEEKTLVEPAHVLLQEVACTRRILRKAGRLPSAECVKTRGCEELEPSPATN